jgi:hypothetical protein
MTGKELIKRLLDLGIDRNIIIYQGQQACDLSNEDVSINEYCQIVINKSTLSKTEI